MKQKHVLFLVGVLTISSYAQGQGFYVKLGAGYALPMGSQSLMEQTTGTEVVGNASVFTSKTTVVKGSYGAGTVINAAAGYKFSPFIGLDLNICYQIGKEYSATSTANTRNATFVITETKKSSGIFFAPTLMFMAGTENVRPYAVVGVIAGSAKIEDRNILDSDNGDTQVVVALKEKTKGDLAFGFRGGIGVDVNLTGRFTLFAEGIFNSISYYAKEKEYTSASFDGDDVLSDFTENERRTIYVDEITTMSVDGVENIDPNQPSQELRSPWPLSSIGINAGLKIKLGSD